MAPARDDVDRLTDLFLQVAAIEGLSGKEGPVARFVVRFLESLGLESVQQPPVEGGEQGNLVCHVGGGGDRVLGCHLDTARSTGRLRPCRLVDRVTSDGTTVLGVDNRLGVAILLDLARRCTHGALPFEPFSLVFTVREETDLAGSRHLAFDERWQRGFVFDSSLRPGHYISGSYGAKRFDGRITGKAAHAGIAPERGVDAIRVAARAIASMPLGRIDADTTANIGHISGGEAINTVPDLVAFTGEVRARDEGRVDQVLADVRGECERAARDAGAGVELEASWDFRPFQLAADAPVCREIERALHAAGLEPERVFSSGGSDANWFNSRGLQTVNIGIGAQNPHANDEFVLLEDLAAVSRIASSLISPR